jgi:hypothetical protein
MAKKVGSPFKGFGWIIQVVVGAIQSTALAVSDAVEYNRTKKYLKSIKGSQGMLHATLLENKKKELAFKEELLKTKEQTELLRDQKLKKLVIIGTITAIAVAFVAMVVIYSIAVGGED